MTRVTYYGLLTVVYVLCLIAWPNGLLTDNYVLCLIILAWPSCYNYVYLSVVCFLR